ncbi:MAG: enoyl-CoA hydratase/isomerase family protein [Actinomycetota bacterium]
MSELVLVDVDDRIATVTLNRPELRNALSIEMCEQLIAALAAVDDLDARAIVVRGNGRAFCSGADFAVVSGERALSFVAIFEEMLSAVSHHRLPVIAAIHGAALGGGLQFASACDFRFAANDAQLGIPSASLGVVVNFENVERLVALAGIAVAKEALMTARTYSAPEAQALGFVNRCVEPARLEMEVGAFAAEIAALAPLAVQGAKRAVVLVGDHLTRVRAASPELAAEMDELVAGAYRSADLAEGLRALAEKRTPRFEGR